MLRERLREMLFGPPAPEVIGRSPAPVIQSNGAAAPAGWERHSHGLDQFFGAIGGRTGLAVLDLGEINQTKVSFITDLGHKMYSEDFLHALDAFFGSGDSLQNQADPRRVEAFLDYTLCFPPDQFDGVLVWDILEYLSRPMLAAVVERLHQILRPHGCLLAVFHTEEKASSMPLYSYRIADARTLFLSPKGRRRPGQTFNNRAIERLFQDFQSVKFFLTRDQLREVIVRR